MNYDRNPTFLSHTPERYANYAASLDKDIPGWHNDRLETMAPLLAAEARKRRDADKVAAAKAQAVDALLKGQEAAVLNTSRVNVVRAKSDDVIIIGNAGVLDQKQVLDIRQKFADEGFACIIFDEDVSITVINRQEQEGSK